MASGRLVFSNWMPALDADGVPIPNAQMFFYVNRTTTLATVYADEALTTPLANPVLADSSGQFVPVWADITLLFSAAVASTTLGQFDTIDDLAPSTTVGGAANKLDRDGGNPEPDFLQNVGALPVAGDPTAAPALAGVSAQRIVTDAFSPLINVSSIFGDAGFGNGVTGWKAGSLNQLDTSFAHAGEVELGFLFSMVSDGSGANGPANSSQTVGFVSIKRDWTDSIQDGEIDGGYVVTRNGLHGDLGGFLTDNRKVFVHEGLEDEYTGNGTEDTYPITFQFPVAESVKVYIDDVLIAPTEYTITGEDDPAGGEIVFDSPPDTGAAIKLVAGFTGGITPVEFSSVAYQRNIDGSLKTLKKIQAVTGFMEGYDGITFRPFGVFTEARVGENFTAYHAGLFNEAAVGEDPPFFKYFVFFEGYRPISPTDREASKLFSIDGNGQKITMGAPTTRKHLVVNGANAFAIRDTADANNLFRVSENGDCNAANNFSLGGNLTIGAGQIRPGFAYTKAQLNSAFGGTPLNTIAVCSDSSAPGGTSVVVRGPTFWLDLGTNAAI